jgi:hypothetical protein
MTGIEVCTRSAQIGGSPGWRRSREAMYLIQRDFPVRARRDTNKSTYTIGSRDVPVLIVENRNGRLRSPAAALSHLTTRIARGHETCRAFRGQGVRPLRNRHVRLLACPSSPKSSAVVWLAVTDTNGPPDANAIRAAQFRPATSCAAGYELGYCNRALCSWHRSRVYTLTLAGLCRSDKTSAGAPRSSP